MAPWIPPAVGFLLILGSMGVTIKLALRDLQWPTIFGWTAIAYLSAVGVLMMRGEMTLGLGGERRGTLFAILSGVGAASSFMLINIALSKGKATEVVPVTSAYPLITVLLAALLLGESLSVMRLVAVLFVVIGLILLGVSGD